MSRRSPAPEASSSTAVARPLLRLLLILLLCPVITLATRSARAGDATAELVNAPGVDAVRRNCTVCHSAALITQSRATREGWLEMIRWMQDTQRLWPLGENEEVILDYLAANYSPSFRGRRPPLAPSLLPRRPGPAPQT